VRVGVGGVVMVSGHVFEGNKPGVFEVEKVLKKI
jgi:hypothetical protein